MVFNVMVAGDVGGTTHNFEYAFPTLPTLSEVKAQVETVFGRERMDGAPPLCAEKLQIYSEAQQDWLELTTGRQLSQGCQVFVFFAPPPPSRSPSPAASARSASPHQQGACDDGTASRRPSEGAPGAGAAGVTPCTQPSAADTVEGRVSVEVPRTAAPPAAGGAAKARAAAGSAVSTRSGSGAPSMSTGLDEHVRARTTFDLMDPTKARKVHVQQLHGLFHMLRLHVAFEVIDGLFARAENARAGVSGYFTYTEWCRVHAQYPRLSETLYARAQQLEAEAEAKQNLSAQQDACRLLRQTADERRHAYHTALDAVDEQRQKVSQFREAVGHCDAAAADAQALEESIIGEKKAAYAELADAEQDKEHARGGELERARTLEAAQVDCEACEREMAQQEAAAIKVRERIRQLDRELELARKELKGIEDTRAERHRVLQSKRRAEQTARDALAEAQTGVQRAADAAARVEESLCKMDVAIREAEGQSRNAQHELVLSQQGHEAEAHELRHLEGRAEESKAVLEEVEESVAAKMREVERLHEDVDELCKVLSHTAEGDGRLVEDEYQLRAQREALDSQEERLGDLQTWLAARRAPTGSRSQTSGSGGSGEVPPTHASRPSVLPQRNVHPAPPRPSAGRPIDAARAPPTHHRGPVDGDAAAGFTVPPPSLQHQQPFMQSARDVGLRMAHPAASSHGVTMLTLGTLPASNHNDSLQSLSQALSGGGGGSARSSPAAAPQAAPHVWGVPAATAPRRSPHPLQRRYTETDLADVMHTQQQQDPLPQVAHVERESGRRDPPLSPRPVSLPTRARSALSEVNASAANTLAAASPAARPPIKYDHRPAPPPHHPPHPNPADLSPGGLVRGLAAAVSEAQRELVGAR